MATEQDVEREETLSTQAPSAAFIGRDEILATVKAHLLKGQHVCLYGVPHVLQRKSGVE